MDTRRKNVLDASGISRQIETQVQSFLIGIR